jgi:hypothetical protein
VTSGKDRKTLYPQGNGPGDSFLDNQFSIDCDDDFIIMSVRMYKYFLANGKDGLEAKQLYDHLLFTARVQNSKKVKANLSYIKNGLGWGNVKVRKAKAFLHAAGLIEYAQEKDDSGQFGEHRIILKSSWNIESFKAWIEKREKRESKESTGGSETNPAVDNESPGESEIDPAEHMGSLESEDTICPVGQSTALPSTGLPVTRHNYKGSYKKEILPQSQKSEVVDNSGPESPSSPPSATSPPAASIGTVKEMQDTLVGMVKSRDPESMFCFIPAETEKIALAFKLHGPDWLTEVFNEYLKSKSLFQVNRFHGEDLPRFIQRSMDRQKSRPSHRTASPRKTECHHCPCCGKTWSASSTLSMCPSCGLELKDFTDHAEIEAHKEWWENRKRSLEKNAG